MMKSPAPLALPALITVGEAATLLRVSASTIYKWIAQDQLGHVRLPSGRLRLTRSQVLEAVSAQRRL